MKKYIIIAFVLVTGVVIYYFGLYTYFLSKDVQEALPTPTSVVESTSTLAVGEFVGIDVIHKGSGQARLVRVGNKNILRFENFQVTSGPDLYVYLSKNTDLNNDIESLGDYIDLGRLKGTSGNQNYEIAGDISGYKTAIVWCKRFSVLFTYAVME